MQVGAAPEPDRTARLVQAITLATQHGPPSSSDACKSIDDQAARAQRGGRFPTTSLASELAQSSWWLESMRKPMALDAAAPLGVTVTETAPLLKTESPSSSFDTIDT